MTSNGVDESRPRFDWYQTESAVVVSVMKRNVAQADCRVSVADGRSLDVSVKTPDDQLSGVLRLCLAHAVDANNVSFRCSAAKIEIKLAKVEGGRWETLEAPADVSPKTVSAVDPSAPAYPTSNPMGPRNWDKIEKEAVEEEEKQELQGDAAVNRLFQQIYANASEETKRAMNKSYVSAAPPPNESRRSLFESESAGTVLSTNWSEVGKDKVDIKPPDCMEYKQWE